MAKPGEWESPMAALERNLAGARNSNISKARIDLSVSAIPPPGTCRVCAHKNVHTRGLCKTCWRLDVQRQVGT